jgi:hypothetical protein
MLLLLGSYSEMMLLLLSIPSPLDITWVYKASNELILAGGTATNALGIPAQHHKTAVN